MFKRFSMDNLAVDTVDNLLQQAADRKIALSLRQNELIVRYPRENKPDPVFLEKLRTNKNRLSDYLRDLGTAEQSGVSIQKNISPLLCHSGKEYYAINSTLKYWVDDTDKQFKKKLHGTLIYKVSGPLEVPVLNKAIAYIVDRHESLRSCFHLLEETYYMSVKKTGEAAFDIDYRDATGGWTDSGIADFSNFAGLEFNLEEGPLFLTRLLKINSNEYILSFALHHAIFDGWSSEVLYKDIFTTYYAFLSGTQPVLPALHFQYKEYQHYLNQYTETFQNRDREHWQLQFPQLPPEIQIPGANNNAPENSIDPGCGAIELIIPETCISALNDLAVAHSTSMFIVLQAFLNLYLYRLTGTQDILIASEMFGRDMIPGADDQVGFYAKMRLIRTVLTGEEDVPEAISKVKRANEDMQKHVAFPLMDVLGRALPGLSLLGTICKITLNYIDLNGYYVKRRPADDFHLPEKELAIEYIGNKGDNVPINWDFNIRFYNFQNRIVLRVIYRKALYEEAAIMQTISGYLTLIEKHTASSEV